jgi:hypothetical protein
MYITVFVLIHFPEAQDKSNWIQTSENYERIGLNKYNFFSKFGFRGKWVKKIKAKTVIVLENSKHFFNLCLQNK